MTFIPKKINSFFILSGYYIASKGKPFDELFGDKIAQSIKSLPSNLRTVVLLSDVEELRHVEIAKTLACPVSTAPGCTEAEKKIQ
jgi:hypothetical protein